jgi:putative addiction module killer protein
MVEIVAYAKTDDTIQALGETGNPEFGIVRALGFNACRYRVSHSRRMTLDGFVAHGLQPTLMIEVRQTEEFSGWLRRLRDANAVARITGRIRRMEMGNPGDSRSVGQGVLEMRIDYGPGYRIYYVHRGARIVILACGGDKRTQQQDIKKALRLAETL